QRSADAEAQLGGKTERIAGGLEQTLGEGIREVEERRHGIGLGHKVGGGTGEALRQVDAGGELRMVEDAETAPDGGLVVDAVGQTDARVEVVAVGGLGAPPGAVDFGETEAADKVVAGGLQRRGTGQVEVDVA